MQPEYTKILFNKKQKKKKKPIKKKALQKVFFFNLTSVFINKYNLCAIDIIPVKISL